MSSVVPQNRIIFSSGHNFISINCKMLCNNFALFVCIFLWCIYATSVGFKMCKQHKTQKGLIHLYRVYMLMNLHAENVKDIDAILQFACSIFYKEQKGKCSTAKIYKPNIFLLIFYIENSIERCSILRFSAMYFPFSY